ncbi:MBL fold metallo-hydrolase [Alkalihalobacillus pseudalcaliphilus]|uniref:MBL fold metallo-hydrolase n=1 Tax=Alkalihalobacillus pseudalcaliphilus TaxID=79884 RepID=UPI00064DD061|nr:MBL fold metallo-hydrolase [Alkalihalobacillus pseudalcaliphilus]KMK76200.1 hypothetical protein AB990_13365 [Alkalihalobacillus pseudalcaliphilus]
MLKKIAENIFLLQVTFPFGIREVNSYLFKGENGYTVIDTGSEAEESILLWQEVIRSGIHIEKVVLTHIHPDHVGLAEWFQREHSIPIHMSRHGYEEIQLIQSSEIDPSILEELVIKNGGQKVPTELLSLDPTPYQFTPDYVFENHEQIMIGDERFVAIWTPGHSSDHYCFYNHEKEILIAGDHILQDISPIIYFSFIYPNENSMKQYLQSLDIIQSYPTKLCLPGHGMIFEDVQKRALEIKAGHERRLEEILTLLSDKDMTIAEIVMKQYKPTKPSRFFGPFITTMARMKYLQEEGMVQLEVKAGLNTYINS